MKLFSKLSKKGQLGGLQAAILSLVVAGVILGVGVTVLDSFLSARAAQIGVNMANLTDTPLANQSDILWNATYFTTQAVGTIGTTWMAIIVTVVASIIILGLILQAFR